MPVGIVTGSLPTEEAREKSSTLLCRARRLACALLRCGEIPHHVAFIMDGNRRFAAAQGLDKAAGHARGFEKVSCPGSKRRYARAHAAPPAAGRAGVVPGPGRSRGDGVRFLHRKL
jgi:hypothetical protein